MSREAFEEWFAGEQGAPYEGMYVFAFAAWQAARAAALEEAADVCERIGPVMAERYGLGAECITTADECADAIRALKEKE